MIIGVVRETFPGEDRVAMVPRVMDLLTKTGAEFLVESSAGEAAGFPDAEYRDKGARIEGDRATIFQTADVILQVRTLGANPQAGRADVPLLRAGQAVIGFSEPLTAIEECAHLAAQGVTTFAME